MSSIKQSISYKPEIDFRYFIYLAFKKQISWDALASLLDGLTMNLAQSKELNKILLKELELSEESLNQTNSEQPLEESKESSQNDLFERDTEPGSYLEIDAEVTFEELSSEPEELQNDLYYLDGDNSRIKTGQNDQDSDIFNIINQSYSKRNNLLENGMHKFLNSSTEDNSSKPGDQFDPGNSAMVKFESDFVGNNGIETKLLTINNSIKEGTNEMEGANTLENFNEQDFDSDDMSSDTEQSQQKNESYLLKRQIELRKECMKFQCKQCDKAFSLKSSLNRHANIHKENIPFQCTICSKLWTNKADLIRHERIHTGEKPFVCESCNRACSTKSELTIHEKVHTVEGLIECKICYKTFSHTKFLRAHEKIHTGEKPFQCEICKKFFSLKFNLKMHKRSHTGEKPYKCKSCSKNFSSPSDLKRHEKTHTGERPHQCQICFKGFIESSKLKNHMISHSGEKPFECKSCPKKYAYLKHLKTHLKTHDQRLHSM